MREEETLRAYALEHRQLVEYHEAVGGTSYSLGDIFLGEVSQVVKGLNAAFVQLGLRREGFLHYSDIGWTLLAQKTFLEGIKRGQVPPLSELPLEAFPPKEGSIADFVRPGDWVLVQVVKEMSETKGPRLSTQIALTGQALVLLPFSSEIGVSHRLTDPLKRQRWRDILREFYRQPYGMILRTNGQYLSPADIQAEYERLINRWEEQVSRLIGQRPPYLLVRESSPLHVILQELLTPPPQRIHVEEEYLHTRIQQYLRMHPLPDPPVVRLHRRKEGLEAYWGLDRATRQLLGRTVTLPNGGYIVIEHTEALHVIDVNSGSLPVHGKPPEEAILQTNLLAAQEVARQLRLRDMGGIIVVDFIDMRQPEHRQLVYERLREAMRADRAKHVLLPMSEFGLVQITRQRRRAPTEILESSPCPACHGSGRLSYTDFPLHHLEEQLRYHSEQYPRVPLRLQVHPLIFAYWRDRFVWRGKWIWNLIPHRWVLVETNAELGFFQAILLSREGVPLVTLI